MNVYPEIENLPPFKHAVITIGAFDGVHKGHQQIIRQLISEAAAVDGTPVMISFNPHPRQVLAGSDQPIELINTPEEKYQLLDQFGIKHIVEVPFTREFADQSPESYISNFLVKNFKPHTIMIGYDHRFGKGRSGDYKLLENMADQYGYEVKEIPEHVVNDLTVSSTRIRKALKEADIKTANDYLGYPYFFSGNVVKGNQLGRTIGYPTANLDIPVKEKLVPGNAVYAVTISIKGRSGKFKGMMNIGTRPTVDGSKRAIEVNIFDFDVDIYGETLIVTIIDQLRMEQKFAGLDALREQLAKDKKAALKSLSMDL
jgi:riboflavin kinase/FMN adenylyltransferase